MGSSLLVALVLALVGGLSVVIASRSSAHQGATRAGVARGAAPGAGPGPGQIPAPQEVRVPEQPPPAHLPPAGDRRGGDRRARFRRAGKGFEQSPSRGPVAVATAPPPPVHGPIGAAFRLAGLLVLIGTAAAIVVAVCLFVVAAALSRGV